MGVDDEILGIREDDFGFSSVARSIIGEEKDRLDKVSRSLSFGVNFLDKTLRAIEVDDFILIGAQPGIGKTEIVTQIALQNALKGKRVHFFALEASPKEIERRMKFRLVMERFYGETKNYSFKLTYYDWYRGAGQRQLSKYSADAEKQMASITSLFIFYRSTSFGSPEFKRTFSGISKETDLVICDHLHYFDLDDDNENRAVKKIMKQMRDASLLHQVPIILVAHLRKKDKDSSSLAPELDDFHGTSDIGKIVTKAVTLAPGIHVGEGVFTTYIRAVKCRFDGGVTRFFIRAKWDAKQNKYLDEYELGTASGGIFMPLPPDRLPLFLESQKHYERNRKDE